MTYQIEFTDDVLAEIAELKKSEIHAYKNYW
jgi:hypothetical protein